MKFSEQWLREWVNPGLSCNELAHQVTMAGLEVEAIEPVAGLISNIVIGEVLTISPHPNADKLKVCQVNVGEKQLLQIVCGANNVAEKCRYPVARIGAKLPAGLEIKKTKLRGVESNGMLCSAKELGMAETSEGLLTLSPDAPVGAEIGEYLLLDDNSIELSLTPNRGDCLSLRGIAREVGVLNAHEVTPPTLSAIKAVNKDTLPVEILATQECPRYAGRVIRNINKTSKTPVWLQERLRRSAIRSINPIVDITNYVMLELGQPMHAFDLNKLQKGVVIRLSSRGESIMLLDGQTIELKEGSLVIADHNQPQALAGIMGGQGSAVENDTTDIFLESAFFNPLSVAGKARSYGLHTDSSHRFERGVDPALQVVAIERATQLILDIVGGEPGPVIDKVSNDTMPVRTPITLRHDRLQAVLGVEIDSGIINDILIRLEMQTQSKNGNWQVTPPSFRFDIEREEDLIEEIARIYGYDKIPVSHPVMASCMQPRPEHAVNLNDIKSILVDCGYQEAITYSFVDPSLQTLIDNQQEKIPVANPISAEMSEMRTSLWPGLLQAFRYNENRQISDVRMFEAGLCFYKSNKETNQEMRIGGLISGRAFYEHWDQPVKSVDFFDIKGHIETLLTLTGQSDTYTFVQGKHPALHPGQTAKIVAKQQENADTGTIIGWVGAIHPSIAQKLDCTPHVYLFELKLAAISSRPLPHFEEISKFPAIRRDLAIIVKKSVSAQEVSNCIRKAVPAHLIDLMLFDVYEGKGIDPASKSLAFGLTLRAKDRTLIDAEVDTMIEQVLVSLNKELGGTLRN